MNITITIQNPTQDAILALAGVVTSYNEQAAAVVVEEPKIGTQTEQPQSQDTSSTEKPKRQRNNSTTKPAPQPEPQPEPEEDITTQDEDSAGDSDEAPKYIPDVVEIRAKAQEVGVTPDGKKAIKALLTKFGVPSVSAIPEDKRAEFLDELNAL